MTTHTAALHEQIATKVQRLRALSDAIFRVTLLAASFRVLFLEHRPEPEFILAVSFEFARSRAAVAPVATRTTKLLDIMKLQDLAVGMTDECARESIRLAAGTTQTRRGYLERLANTGMTNLATVDDVVLIDADLMTQDRVVVIRHLGLE